MKDYLNAKERNDLLVLMTVIQLIDGKRSIKEQGGGKWLDSSHLSVEEKKNLRTSRTYLKKFCESVYNRMSIKEKDVIDKKFFKFDFRLVDDFTLDKIYRDRNNKMAHAVMPREQFQDWTELIMNVECKNCSKDHKVCHLHDIFQDNFIPESTHKLINCRYSYTKDEKSNNSRAI